MIRAPRGQAAEFDLDAIGVSTGFSLHDLGEKGVKMGNWLKMKANNLRKIGGAAAGV